MKIAWQLNAKLKISLKESEIFIPAKDNPSNVFPVFCDRDTSDTLYYSLIANKSSNGQLVKELPNIDYFLEISGDINKSIVSLLIKEVKQLPGIAAAIEINPEKIKRRNAFCAF
jgi:hypothetical protein